MNNKFMNIRVSISAGMPELKGKETGSANGNREITNSLKKRFADSLNELSLLFHKQMELTY